MKTSSVHLLDEDLGHITVVVEGSQMKRREAVLLLNIHQLPCSGQNLLCGPAPRTKKHKTQLGRVHNTPHGLN